MGITQTAFLGILVAVAMQRIAELRISRRNQRRLLAKGAVKASEPRFAWMVAVHVGILVGAAAEVLLLNRSFFPTLAATMSALFLASNALRWWVIRTMGSHWNVQVMESTKIGVVVDGPYRWVRHPNYVAVFTELIALPLIHTAWLTASIGAIAHWAVLRQRLRVEESILLSSSQYRYLMGSKPRFLPRVF